MSPAGPRRLHLDGGRTALTIEKEYGRPVGERPEQLTLEKHAAGRD